MANQQTTGFRRIINASKFSLAGFKAVWKHEEAFRQELVLAGVLFPLALILGGNNIEKLILIGSIVLVLLAELFNSAIEAVVDRVGLEQHELSGRAKDIGSAAVTLTLIWVVITWTLILI